MSDFVRVQTENGLYASVNRAHAEATGMKIVAGAEATDRYGQPLPQSGPDQEDVAGVMAASVDPYEGKSYTDLKTEIETRNASRPEDQQIPVGRSQADLVAALTAADLA